VTCGGLCPGINTVIREIVFGLKNMYGVEDILGIEVSFVKLHFFRYLLKYQYNTPSFLLLIEELMHHSNFFFEELMHTTCLNY